MERFSALVLSQDGETLRIINKVLEEHGLEASIVHNIGQANQLLKDQKFDLAVCDYDLPGAQELSYLQPGNAWRGMFFALIHQEQVSYVRGRRVHITLPKPITPRLFSRGLRAAYTTIVHERRSALRVPVEVEASWAELNVHGERRELDWARIVNVSQTGMCLHTRQLLPQQATVAVNFELPQQGGLVTLEGEVVWAKSPGRCGLRFKHIPAAAQKRLMAWLESKIPREFT